MIWTCTRTCSLHMRVSLPRCAGRGRGSTWLQHLSRRKRKCRSSSDLRGAKVNLIALVDTAWMMAIGDAADEDDLAWRSYARRASNYRIWAPPCGAQLNCNVGNTDILSRWECVTTSKPSGTVRIAWRDVRFTGCCYCCCRRPCPTPSVIDTRASWVVCWTVVPDSFISSHHCAADRTTAPCTACARTNTSLYMRLGVGRMMIAVGLLPVASATYISMMHYGRRAACARSCSSLVFR